MGDVLDPLKPYVPYILGGAVAVFVAYIWFNRKKFRSANMVAITGLMTALVFVATRVIQINLPTGGYLNFGDTMIMFTSMLFGPVVGAFAGGVGSAMADAFSPYAGWAPITLVVKGLEGLAVGYLAQRNSHTGNLVLAGVIGGIIMVTGYFLFEIPLLGLSVALTEIPPNTLQAVTGVLVGTGLATAVKRRYPEVEDLI
ncbi:MAG: ECF transporter S component [Thermococcus sp.]|nr:ECF transporter S component [Thermococcus sp.]